MAFSFLKNAKDKLFSNPTVKSMASNVYDAGKKAYGQVNNAQKYGLFGGALNAYNNTALELFRNMDRGNQQQTPPSNARFSSMEAFNTNAPQTVQQQQRPQFDTSGFQQRMQDIGNKNRELQQQQAQSQEESFRRLQGIREQQLRSQVPGLQNQLNKYTSAADQSIANMQAATDDQKQKIRTQSGEAMRRAAQTNRENQQALQNTFAGLNTLDSSVFQQQAARQTNDFTRNQNTRLQDQAMQMNEADRVLTDFRNQAELDKMAEVERFNQAIRDIEANVDVNSEEYDQLIRQAYSQAQQNIQTIDQQLLGAEMDFQSQMYQSQLKNQPTAASNAIKSDAVMAIDSLLQKDLSRIFGLGKYNPMNKVPGTEGANIQASFDNLKDKIAMIQREYLKGTGTVTDWEAKTAANAALALDQAQSPEQFQAALVEFRNNLATQTGQPSVAGAQDNIDPAVLQFMQSQGM